MKITVTDKDLFTLQTPFWVVVLDICYYLDGENMGYIHKASFFNALQSLREKRFKIVDAVVEEYPSLCYSDMLFTCVVPKKNASYADAFLLMKNIGNNQGDFR